MYSRSCRGFSSIELAVAIVVLVALGFSVSWYLGRMRTMDAVSHGLSNAKQLHLATMQMTLDGQAAGDKNLGWPGDTGGTFTNWAHQLVAERFLRSNDFRKMMSAPGVTPPADRMPTAEECALVVYTVGTNSREDAVFLSSANFSNTPAGGLPLRRGAKPYGNVVFLVYRKAGDGAILQPERVGDTNLIGSYEPLCR